MTGSIKNPDNEAATPAPMPRDGSKARTLKQRQAEIAFEVSF